MQEKRLIQKYFDEISLDTGKYCFGLDDTFRALEMGAVETLIVWENLEHTRYVMRDSQGAEQVLMLSKEQEQDRSYFTDKATGMEMEQIEEPMPLLEWIAENYKQFGTNLECTYLLTSRVGPLSGRHAVRQGIRWNGRHTPLQGRIR